MPRPLSPVTVTLIVTMPLFRCRYPVCFRAVSDKYAGAAKVRYGKDEVIVKM